MSNSNLTGVDLSNASLEYANLYGAELSDAVLSNVQLDESKVATL
ncbi:MAG: pentapeptide repeat-containing protein [Coraliomargaritaceae bacterium]